MIALQVHYYHGGRGGMSPGQFVLPPSITGSKVASGRYGNKISKPDRVYVTTDPLAALMYAVTVRDGEVYQVAPESLAPDPDCIAPGLSFECTRASVVKRVRFTKAQRNLVARALLENFGREASAR